MTAAPSAVLSFDLNLEEIPVTLLQKDSSVPLECVLVEMTGYARDMFMNSQKKRANFRTKEVTDFKDVQTELITRCLVYKDKTDEKTGNRLPVEAAVIRDFPAKVMGSIYEKCVEMNGLNEKAENEVKND